MNLNATILGQAISFFLFVFFCMKYIWPPIIFAINSRQKEISNSLLHVKIKKQELDSYREKINNEINIIKLNMKEIINQTNQKKNNILKKANIQAQEERKKILKKTEDEIKIAYQKLKLQLNKETSKIAIKISEKIIKDNINNKNAKNIIDNLIKVLNSRTLY
ncbi:MAG: F0F1 ATP synthase subunit B [Buchnera aphidicola (Nurudea shiraii)]